MHTGTGGASIATRIAIGAGQGVMLTGGAAAMVAATPGLSPKSGGQMFAWSLLFGALAGAGSSALVESINAIEASSSNGG